MRKYLKVLFTKQSRMNSYMREISEIVIQNSLSTLKKKIHISLLLKISKIYKLITLIQ